MLKRHLILGVHITNRVKRAPEVQKVLTEYGCYIRTRLGLHHASETECSPSGLVLIETTGDPKKCSELAAKLTAIEGLGVKKMVFTHP